MLILNAKIEIGYAIKQKIIFSKCVGEPTTVHVQKFRANYLKNIIGISIGILAFLTGIITGLYEIIEGKLFFEDQNEIFGGVMVILGIVIPFYITTILLNWEKEQNLDLALVLFTLILYVLLIALYIYLPMVIFFLIQFQIYAILIIGLGIGFLLASFRLITVIPKNKIKNERKNERKNKNENMKKKEKKWRFGGFLLVMGNHLLILGSYCLIGGITTQ